MTARFCCVVECKGPAEWEIRDTRDGLTTDACTKHVGDLLGSVPPTKPIGPWEVSIIEECAGGDTLSAHAARKGEG